MSVQILQFATQYTFYTTCIIFTFGVLGNALNILVFTQLKLFRNNRPAFYLTIESFLNFIYLFISISTAILTAIYGDDATGRSLIWCRFRYALIQTVVLTTSCIICFAAADQFFSTNYRFHRRQICTMKLARCLTFTFLCIWIIHSIVFGFFFDIQPSFGCVISNFAWLKYSTYFFYPVLAGPLPIVIASLFSILAFRDVRRIIRRQLPIVRRRLDRQMTALILMRVIIFVCLSLPYNVYRIYTINFPVTRNKPMEYAIGRLLQVIFSSFVALNYSVNFYMFTMTSSYFLRQVKYLLVKRYWQRLKFCCCYQNNRIHPENVEPQEANVELEEVI